MKRLFPILILACALSVMAQAPAGKIFCTDGYVKFFSKTSMENIQAETHTAVAIFEPSSGKLRVRMQNKSFVFPNHLMQDHFNENYMESDKYPLSIFEGVATGLDWSKIKPDVPQTATFQETWKSME